MIGISTRTLTKYRNGSRCCETRRRKRKRSVHGSHHIYYRSLPSASTERVVDQRSLLLPRQQQVHTLVELRE